MSAKEMFEKLGYMKEEDDYSITYSKDILDKQTFGYVDSEMICFDDIYKSVYFTNKSHITLDELQTINKQVEELGWLEEVEE